MIDVVPGIKNPQVNEFALDTDTNHNCQIVNVIRYNGEGIFVCAVLDLVNNNCYQMNVALDTQSNTWKSSHYVQLRYPDLEGSIKNM